MFGLFRKKSPLEKLIKQDGIEHASDRISEIICEKLGAKHVAYQFILEEVEAASQGDREAIAFARASGISPTQYNGAMNRSFAEVDGPDGPQQLLLHTCMQLMSNKTLMVQFRTKVADKVMKRFSIGKYELAHKGFSLDDLIAESANLIVDTVNKNSFEMLNKSGAIEMVKETISGINGDVNTCRHNVLALLTLISAAKSAFDDNDKGLANYLSQCCKELVEAIWQLPNEEYNDLEFSLVDYSIETMKSIDLS